MATKTHSAVPPTAYFEAFTALQRRMSDEPAWLRIRRQEAFDSFCDRGFPTLKDEDWRFTNTASIARLPYHLPTDAEARLSSKDVQSFLIRKAACHLVFVNGRFAPELSACGTLHPGVKAGSLATEMQCRTASIALHLDRYHNQKHDAFSNLNAAFWEDGAYIHIARGAILKAPIHILNLSVETKEPVMVHSRNLLIADADTQADIVEEYASLSSGVVFFNTMTEIAAGENAVLSHCLIERQSRNAFQVSTLSLHQARNANVSAHSVLTGGALVRNNVHLVLDGAGAVCLINGLFIGDDGQHLDNYMFVEHASPYCESKQFYNGILGANARGVFHGRILVHKDAQKTNAKQTNRNLLLSDDAQIDTKPQLEIYANDVKCTHGATIGQVDESSLFYLRSRGLDEGEARALLLYGFAGECLERIKSEVVRERAECVVRQSLPDAVPLSVTASAGDRRWEEVG